MYIYPWKKLIKMWSIFVMQLRKSSFFFCLARGVLLDNGATSPWGISMHKRCILGYKLSIFCRLCPKWLYMKWASSCIKLQISCKPWHYRRFGFKYTSWVPLDASVYVICQSSMSHMNILFLLSHKFVYVLIFHIHNYKVNKQTMYQL